jgi:hypothetical protein
MGDFSEDADFPEFAGVRPPISATSVSSEFDRCRRTARQPGESEPNERQSLLATTRLLGRLLDTNFCEAIKFRQ